MFGYKATEMYGKSLSILIPPTLSETNRSLQTFISGVSKGQANLNAMEMRAQRQDGTIFHINLSISEGRVGGKSFCAVFIRDTETQEKIDKLLSSILPKYSPLFFSKIDKFDRSIAQVLQQDIDNPNRPLIAEGFKEVTILFADIVGFTTMSSNISPRELIFMLNTIFSEWDSLCEKWHLEKIKTVGGNIFVITSFLCCRLLYVRGRCASTQFRPCKERYGICY